MVTYGELIHMHREGDFVNSKTGKYLDDDFDMLASLETTVYVAKLENELFTKQGWSMRVFVNYSGYVVFMQMMAVCGHKFSPRMNKIRSTYPGIDVYPLAIVDNGDGT